MASFDDPAHGSAKAQVARRLCIIQRHAVDNVGMDRPDPERAACLLRPLDSRHFNKECILPYGCTVDAIRSAMNEFLDFLQFVNAQLNERDIQRLETMLMPANFSSMVGEFIAATVPRHCSGLVRNRYHNGHPDLLPAGRYPGDSQLHACEGIEIKASRYSRGWQGHNPEDVWLMVFVFDANRARDDDRGIPPKPFRFLKVAGAKLTAEDWKFSGRFATSRRTITASVTREGFDKMETNWIYRLRTE